MHKTTVDVYDQIAVSFVKLLQHFLICHPESRGGGMRDLPSKRELTQVTSRFHHILDSRAMAGPGKPATSWEFPRRLRDSG
jgi:hypothetical protein